MNNSTGARRTFARVLPSLLFAVLVLAPASPFARSEDGGIRITRSRVPEPGGFRRELSLTFAGDRITMTRNTNRFEAWPASEGSIGVFEWKRDSKNLETFDAIVFRARSLIREWESEAAMMKQVEKAGGIELPRPPHQSADDFAINGVAVALRDQNRLDAISFVEAVASARSLKRVEGVTLSWAQALARKDCRKAGDDQLQCVIPGRGELWLVKP